MNMNENRSCNATLKRLRAVDFALQETVLYLNAYPKSKQALRYYHRLIKEREQLMDLSRGRGPSMPLLTAEEQGALAAYARSETRSPAELRAERDALLALLQRSREQTAAEIKNKGQVYRSVGYLTGVAALLLVL